MVKCDQTTNESVIRLEGEVDITCSVELKTMLIDAIAAGKPLQIDLSTATALDVTALQLLWLVRVEAAKNGIPLTWTEQVPDPIRFTLAEAGLEGLTFSESNDQTSSAVLGDRV